MWVLCVSKVCAGLLVGVDLGSLWRNPAKGDLQKTKEAGCMVLAGFALVCEGRSGAPLQNLLGGLVGGGWSEGECGRSMLLAS